MAQYGQGPPYNQPYDQQQYPQQPYGQQQNYGGQQQQYGQQPPPQTYPTQHTPQEPARGAPATVLHPSDTGTFAGGSYTVTHRDTNAVLTIDLQQGSTVTSKPGAMIHMSGTIQLTGQVKLSFKKMLTGGQMASSTYAGHGKVALAPLLQGDIITLHVDGRTPWKVGKDAFLASTSGVTKETKSQGFTKAMFSGESLFVYHIAGQGLLWLTSYGAVDKLDLRAGEHHIVDNGHLVAWSCDYKIEKAGGGMMASLKTGEGLVCRFTGPGTVYVQTRNKDDFEEFIRDCVPSNR